MEDASEETDLLLGCRTHEDRQKVLAELFLHYRDRLKLMVRLRLSDRLRRRIDPSDIVQDAYVEVMERLDAYLGSRPMPLFVWLRRITAEKLIDCFRRHLGVQARDARRECQAPVPRTTIAALTDQLVARGASPSEAAIRAEAREQVQRVLESMNPLDREVLALRHFELLSNSEIACELGIDESAASKRYLRALKRLRRMLGAEAPP